MKVLRKTIKITMGNEKRRRQEVLFYGREQAEITVLSRQGGNRSAFKLHEIFNKI